MPFKKNTGVEVLPVVDLCKESAFLLFVYTLLIQTELPPTPVPRGFVDNNYSKTFRVRRQSGRIVEASFVFDAIHLALNAREKETCSCSKYAREGQRYQNVRTPFANAEMVY